MLLFHLYSLFLFSRNVTSAMQNSSNPNIATDTFQKRTEQPLWPNSNGKTIKKKSPLPNTSATFARPRSSKESIYMPICDKCTTKRQMQKQ